MEHTIPNGATLQRTREGNILITFPGAVAPRFCVRPNGTVRRAILRIPVEQEWARAALQYVREHQQA